MLATDHLQQLHGADVRWVSVAEIGRDERVNTRPVDNGWVDAKVREGFDPNRLGVPTVSRRKDGSYVFLDGQNRGELLRRAGWPSQKIQVRVFENLTLAEEAALFLGLNDNRQVMPVYKFLARVTAGEEHAVAIDSIVRSAGWHVSDTGSGTGIAAVRSLETVYHATPKQLGRALSATLRVGTEAWGFKSEAVNGHVVHGLGMVHVRFADQLDTPALIKKLCEFPGGPSGLLGKARGLRQYQGGTVANCVAQTVVTAYNQRRRTGALPDWR
jgi:hypothetical protein